MPPFTFRTRDVAFFITHDRRERVRGRVPAHPTAECIWRPFIGGTTWGRHPKHLLRDRAAGSGRDVPERAPAFGSRTLLTPFRAPRATASAERVIRTLRTGCLDRVLVLNERHPEGVLREYLAGDNGERPHRSPALAPPRPAARSPVPAGAFGSTPVLGGLHRVYHRAA